MKRLFSTLLISFICLSASLNAQTYRHIYGWSQEINDRIEGFLNGTIP